MDELQGKVAIVTGGSSGIGAAIAEHFAGCGCRLTLAARRERQLGEVRGRCVAAGLKPGEVITVVADVSKLEDLDRIVDETVKAFGEINYLINNAGVVVFKGVRLMNEEEFDRIMNINVKSAQFLSVKALPHLSCGAATTTTTIFTATTPENIVYDKLKKKLFSQYCSYKEILLGA